MRPEQEKQRQRPGTRQPTWKQTPTPAARPAQRKPAEPRLARGTAPAPMPVAGDGMWSDSFAERWGRRLVSFSGLTVASFVYTALLPVLVVAGAVIDLLRGRRQLIARFHIFIVGSLWWHDFGLVPLFALWVWGGRWFGRTPGWWRQSHRRLESWWVDRVVAWAEFVYGMRVTVEGLECLSPGPVFLFARHASIVDTILPTIRIIAGAHDMTLRIVKKRVLLWDPCVDVISHRLPRTFVRRGSGNAEREVALVERMLGGVGEKDVVAIFPEGTRFTRKKREQVIASLRQKNPELAARAQRLKNLLPPKPLGALSMIEKRPDMDVVFCAHTGLEEAGQLEDFISGCLLDAEVKVRYWRVPVADIPESYEERVWWLFSWWERLDRWVDGNRGRKCR